MLKKGSMLILFRLKSTTALWFMLAMVLCFAFASCKKDDGLPDSMALFYYAETSCADPWIENRSNTDYDLHALVSDYLANDLDIEFNNLRITQDGTQQVCLACTCTTGRIISIEADRAYEDILMMAGFKTK